MGGGRCTDSAPCDPHTPPETSRSRTLTANCLGCFRRPKLSNRSTWSGQPIRFNSHKRSGSPSPTPNSRGYPDPASIFRSKHLGIIFAFACGVLSAKKEHLAESSIDPLSRSIQGTSPAPDGAPLCSAYSGARRGGASQPAGMALPSSGARPTGLAFRPAPEPSSSEVTATPTPQMPHACFGSMLATTAPWGKVVGTVPV